MTVTLTSCFLAGLLGKRELGAQGIMFQLQTIALAVIIVSRYYLHEKQQRHGRVEKYIDITLHWRCKKPIGK